MNVDLFSDNVNFLLHFHVLYFCTNNVLAYDDLVVGGYFEVAYMRRGTRPI